MYPGRTPWQVSSSFVSPVPIPSSAPGDTPRTCVSFNSGWLPLVIGALLQLAQPAAWDTADDSARNAVLLDVQDLLARFGVGGGCMQLRWSPEDCAIEQSTDDGATWTAIDGWDLTSVQGCVMGGLSIRIDAGGNLQWSIDGGSTWTNVDGWAPGTPPNPSGASDDQEGCNIATHLTQNIILGALQSAIDSFNATIAEAVAGAAVLALIPVFGPEVALTIEAAAGITYLIYHTGSIGDYEAAVADPYLAHALQCAIYNVIKTDGAVTAANYADVVTAINAIGYSPTDVQDAIDAFIDSLGLNGLLAAQQLGGLELGDCTTCGSAPVALFDGTSDYLKGTGRLLNRTFSQDWTICFWARPDSTAGSTGGFIFAEGDSGATQPTMALLYNFTGTLVEKWILDWYMSSPSFVWTRDYTNGTVPWDAWSHITVVHAASGAYGFYVNGVSVTTTHIGNQAISTRISDGNTYSGAENNSGTFDEFFKGKLADLRIYHSQLTTTQAHDIYLAGINGYLPVGSPVHWWKLNEGTGSTAGDSGSAPASLTWHGSGSHWGTP